MLQLTEGAGSREQGGESREQGAGRREQRAGSREQRARKSLQNFRIFKINKSEIYAQLLNGK
jgi:hypothetical protein